MKHACFACNYALLQYLPHPETGEFVNVGVVVHCGAPSAFDFALEETMTARVKAMFPRQGEATFAATICGLRRELERIRAAVSGDPDRGLRLFAEVVRRREATFRFGEIRTILATDVGTVAEDLFRRYVRMEEVAPALSP